MAILELENISKRYGTLTALEPMNLSFHAEKTYVLLGTSELKSHKGCFDATSDEHYKCSNPIKDSNPLVVDCCYPAP